MLQDFARDGEDLLDTLLASAQRAPALPTDPSGQPQSRQDMLAHAGMIRTSTVILLLVTVRYI